MSLWTLLNKPYFDIIAFQTLRDTLLARQTSYTSCSPTVSWERDVSRYLVDYIDPIMITGCDQPQRKEWKQRGKQSSKRCTAALLKLVSSQRFIVFARCIRTQKQQKYKRNSFLFCRAACCDKNNSSCTLNNNIIIINVLSARSVAQVAWYRWRWKVLVLSLEASDMRLILIFWSKFQWYSMYFQKSPTIPLIHCPVQSELFILANGQLYWLHIIARSFCFKTSELYLYNPES